MRSTSAAGFSVLTVVLAACTQVVPLQPADDATAPECAEIIVRLPHNVGGQEARETNAQATGAWGSPAAVLLRCGVAVPGPTAELPCVTVEGIDWLRDASAAPDYVFTTYGRDPATEVIVDNEKAAGITVLTDLASAISVLPRTRECISLEDAIG